MNIKLIALDLDGTTLNEQGKLSQRTRASLCAAHDKGIDIVIATGRPFAALPDDVLELEAVRYVLTSNGAVITDLKLGKVIYRNCISVTTILAACEMLRRMPHAIEAFTEGKAYMEAEFYNHISKTGKSFRNVDYILSTRKPVEDIWGLILENKDKIENLDVNYEDAECRDELKAKLETLPGATVTSSFPHAFEIGGETTSKADALSKMCQILEITPQQMMAAGDSHNDIAMLEISGFAVAMGNGEDEVKHIADYVAPQNSEDGLAQAIEKFIL